MWKCERLVLFLVMGMVLPSCQSFLKKKSAFPHDLRGFKEGVFKGNMVVRIKNREKHRLKAEVSFLPSEGLKLDLTAVLNLPVLSLRLKKSGEVLALLFQNRQYYRGKNRFFPFFHLSLPLLEEVLFDRVPKGWLCQMDFRQKPLACKKRGQEILWQRTHGRTLTFKNKDHQIKLYFSEFYPKILKEVFDLKVPSHFKPIKNLFFF